MKYPLVIFDLDGTILDTLEDLHESVNTSMDAFAMPHRSLAEVRSFVGNGIRRLIELSVPENTPAVIVDQVQQVFSTHYKQHCNDKTRPYDGIPELIRDLRNAGHKTAVVSNKDDYAVRTLCERHFPGLFDAVVGSRDGVRKKPAPDSVNEVLFQLGFSSGEAIYIGDSEVDLQTANNAGITLITVAWGFRDSEYLQKIGCRNVAATVKQLHHMLTAADIAGQSIVEEQICSKDFPYLQPYFYSNPYALRCELGIGDDDAEYMNSARTRAFAIYNMLFPNGADAIIFNYWIYDRSTSGIAEYLEYCDDDDPAYFIEDSTNREAEQTRFLLECQHKYRHLVIRNLATYDDSDDEDCDIMRRNRIVCFSDGIGFDHQDFINRQINQEGDHDISFVSFEHECIFSIYDDRGCDVVFMTKEKMKQFYPMLQPYFLEYDLEEMKRRYEA